MERVISTLFFFAITFLGVWIVMLFLGAAHSYDERIPAFGYIATCWLFGAATTVLQVHDIRKELP